MTELTYGQQVDKARQMTDKQEIGETVSPVMKRFHEIIEDIVQKEHDRGTKGKYYIHIWVRKDPYAVNSLHIFPQSRRTRPSPYQKDDHFLWSVQDGGLIKFEWCIPSKPILKYILDNPNSFDKNYVAMLRRFCKDQIEKIEDYFVNGKVS